MNRVVPLSLLLFAHAASPGQDEESFPALHRLSSPDAAVRRAAERELADTGAPALPALRRALARDAKSLEDRVDALVRRLADPAWKEREEAARALVRLGRAARARLLEHVATAEPEVAWRLRAILAEVKEFEPVEATLGVRRDAALCRLLGRAGDGSSAGLILAAMGRTEGASADGALELRLGALGALADLRGSLSSEQVERAAQEGLKIVGEGRHPRMTVAALRLLGRLKSPSAAGPLAALVGDAAVKDLHVKRAALAALAALDLPDATRAVVLSLKRPEPYLREAALQVLASAGGPDAGIDPAAGPATDAALAPLRGWWETKHGRAWDSDAR